jgi:hypothetical protein
MAAALLAGSLTGCASLQELTSSSKPLLGESSKKTAPATPAASASVSAPARESGPLDTGSVVHRVKQGNFTVTLTYWTSDNAKLYTAASTKTVSIAAHIEDTNAKNRVTVSSFRVTQDDGRARTEAHADSGSFDVTPPYPYNTVVTLPPATTGAKTLNLSFRMDLLVETAPKSNSYYRSTALDTLVLPLVQEGDLDD